MRDEVKILVDAVARGILTRDAAVAKEYLTPEERAELFRRLFDDE
jgi:hypothetical protein